VRSSHQPAISRSDASKVVAEIRHENCFWSFGGRNGRKDFAPENHDGSKEMRCRTECWAAPNSIACGAIGTLPAMSVIHHRQRRNDVNKPESKSHQGQLQATRLRVSREMLTITRTVDCRSACGDCLSVFSLCHKLHIGLFETQNKLHNNALKPSPHAFLLIQVDDDSLSNSDCSAASSTGLTMCSSKPASSALSRSAV